WRHFSQEMLCFGADERRFAQALASCQAHGPACGPRSEAAVVVVEEQIGYGRTHRELVLLQGDCIPFPGASILARRLPFSCIPAKTVLARKRERERKRLAHQSWARQTTERPTV